MTSDGIACDYIDCDHPRATSWGWITASNGIDELSFCSQEHHDIWIEKNAGNFWDLKGLGSDDVRYGPRKTPKEDTSRVEYKCKLSPHITDENKQAIIQSLMTQFQGYNLNPTIVAPQDSYAFTISLDKGEMATSEIKDKLLWNYFIDNVSTRSDAKVVRNLHVDFLDKESSMVDGEPYDSTVDSNLHADTDGHNPQYIIDQDDIDGPQRSASVKVSNDELPLPDHVEDENKHQSIANYLKWKYNWNEMNRFGKPISDYSSSDVNKNLSILHGFTTDAWGDKCTCPLCSFARSVPSGSCSSCDKTYDQNLGDRIYVLRPGTNNIKKDVWTYNPETNDHRCPDCVGSIKTASLFIDTTDAEKQDIHNKNIDLHDYAYARRYGATHNEILNADSKGVHLNDYGHAREYGANHKETLEAHNKGANLFSYGYCRELGATHDEALEAHNKGINLSSYGDARDSGATHKEILDSDSKGINLNDYAFARAYGATHNEIIEAHNKGVHLVDYGYARDGGYTHEQAMREQIPNYNPYDDVFNKSSSIHEAIPYHVSPDYNRESIEEHGLQPNRPHHDWDWEKQWDPGMNVFLSPTDDDATTWARQIQSTWRDEEDSDDSGREYPHDFDLYHVNTEGLSGIRPGMTDMGKEELVSKAPISPDRITHIETFDPWYEERIDQNTHTKESSMGIICDKCGKFVSLDEWQQSDNWTGKVFTGEGPHYCPSCSNNKKIDGNV